MYQGLVVPVGHLFLNEAVEFQGPGIGRRTRVGPVQAAQVMHHVAAARDKNAFVPPHPQVLGELEVLFHARTPVQAELEDRYVGLRIDVLENGPRTVIQAPLMAFMHGEAHYCGRSAVGSVGGSRCGVLNVEQLLREDTKVVDRRRFGMYAQQRTLTGSANSHPSPLPISAAPTYGQLRHMLREGAVSLGVHRAAVSDEDARYARPSALFTGLLNEVVEIHGAHTARSQRG